MALKTNMEILLEIFDAVEEFQKKLYTAIENEKENHPKRGPFASCKRAAFDLKNELTKLTQSSKYRYK